MVVFHCLGVSMGERGMIIFIVEQIVVSIVEDYPDVVGEGYVH